MRITPPRYVVGIPSERICYEGELRVMAWLSWLLHRKAGAVAFDRVNWVNKPSCWLIVDQPPVDFFKVPVPSAVSFNGSIPQTGEGVWYKFPPARFTRDNLQLAKLVGNLDSFLLVDGDFSKWKWSQMAAPAHNQNGFRWALRRFLLRRFIKSGGVLIIIGKARSGKTLLLERLMPGSIIENVRCNGFQRNARIIASDIPDGIFAIDETSYHHRDDVIDVLNETATAGRGLALVFQWHDIFRKYNLAGALAARKVLFLEFL